MRICKTCGVREDDHHDPDWLVIPDGCVCNWREWVYDGKDKLPPICGNYADDGHGLCQNCEHDKACHETTEAMK